MNGRACTGLKTHLRIQHRDDVIRTDRAMCVRRIRRVVVGQPLEIRARPRQVLLWRTAPGRRGNLEVIPKDRDSVVRECLTRRNFLVRDFVLAEARLSDEQPQGQKFGGDCPDSDDGLCLHGVLRFAVRVRYARGVTG